MAMPSAEPYTISKVGWASTARSGIEGLRHYLEPLLVSEPGPRANDIAAAFEQLEGAMTRFAEALPR